MIPIVNAVMLPDTDGPVVSNRYRNPWNVSKSVVNPVMAVRRSIVVKPRSKPRWQLGRKINACVAMTPKTVLVSISTNIGRKSGMETILKIDICNFIFSTPVAVMQSTPVLCLSPFYDNIIDYQPDRTIIYIDRHAYDLFLFTILFPGRGSVGRGAFLDRTGFGTGGRRTSRRDGKHDVP